MKTLKNLATNEVKRVKDETAIVYVDSGKFIYIPKNEWKESKAPAVVAVAEKTPEQEREIQRKADNKKHRDMKKNAHKSENGHKTK